MKKIIFIILLTVMAAVLAACSNKEPAEPNEDGPVLSVSSSVNTVKQNTAIKYTVTSSAPVYYDVEINVSSNNPEVASVSPAKLILPAGQKKIEGNVTALSDGKAVISITSTDLSIRNGSFTLIVSSDNEEPDEFELSLVIDGDEFKVGDKVPFAVNSPIVAPEDVEIIIVSNPQSAVSIPEKLILLKGEKSVASEMEMLEPGTATVIITSHGYKINVGSVELDIAENNNVL